MTERDKEQIEKLLAKARKWVAKELVCPHQFLVCKHDDENCPIFCIDQALALIRKPTCSTCGDSGWIPKGTIKLSGIAHRRMYPCTKCKPKPEEPKGTVNG